MVGIIGIDLIIIIIYLVMEVVAVVVEAVIIIAVVILVVVKILTAKHLVLNQFHHRTITQQILENLENKKRGLEKSPLIIWIPPTTHFLTRASSKFYPSQLKQSSFIACSAISPLRTDSVRI